MIFSPNKHFLKSFSNKQKIKRFPDLPILSFFGMLAETRVLCLGLTAFGSLEPLFLLLLLPSQDSFLFSLPITFFYVHMS